MSAFFWKRCISKAITLKNEFKIDKMDSLLVLLKPRYFSLRDFFFNQSWLGKSQKKNQIRTLIYKHIIQSLSTQLTNKDQRKNAEDLAFSPMVLSYMMLAIMVWLVFSKNERRQRHLKRLNYHPKEIFWPDSFQIPVLCNW